ncbi:MAG: class C sortase [Firmicutes bacterium]|nr:class C sortase [Bacillota bacterium]
MKHNTPPKSREKKDRLWTAVLVCVFLVGMAILLYPSVSDWWNTRTQSKAVASYDAQVSSLSEVDYSAYFEAAAAYNEKLHELGSSVALAAPDQVEGDYWSLLNITDSGIMGYVTIEKINIQLPIYHGTDASVLQVGVGHLQGSSLPVGGEGTHSVISAHRGLPSARLFTDIDQLEVGDTFTITVLGQVFTYKVDLISIVLPSKMEALYIADGMDYCTLMTCTPYGVNTHRLLVRGVRTTNEEEALIYVTADAYQIEPILVAPLLAVPLLLVLLVWLLAGSSRRRKSPTPHDDQPEG